MNRLVSYLVGGGMRKVKDFEDLLLMFRFSSVFWDLYSAAPERRDQHPHSEEAKAFHDYVSERKEIERCLCVCSRDLSMRMVEYHLK